MGLLFNGSERAAWLFNGGERQAIKYNGAERWSNIKYVVKNGVVVGTIDGNTSFKVSKYGTSRLFGTVQQNTLSKLVMKCEEWEDDDTEYKVVAYITLASTPFSVPNGKKKLIIKGTYTNPYPLTEWFRYGVSDASATREQLKAGAFSYSLDVAGKSTFFVQWQINAHTTENYNYTVSLQITDLHFE